MIYGSSMNLLDCRVGTYLLHDDTGKSEIGRGQVGGDGVGEVHFFLFVDRWPMADDGDG